MAVITRYIIVRNGIELDKVFEDRKEADAYDKMLDAADNLAAFINDGDLQLDLDGKVVEALSVYLAKNGPEVTRILRGIKPVPPAASDAPKPPAPAQDNKGPAKKPTAKLKSK